MTKSYPKAGGAVNSQAQTSGTSTGKPAPAAAPDRNATRTPATFTPYHWEAYNEIVEPRRFDHYLIRKWLPELGGDGLAVVKVLRDRCYHNPTTGVLRNEVEISLDELAAACSINERTLRRLFQNNAALGQFVQAIAQYSVVGNQTRRKPNAYRVCMDEPIHPDDMELYDQLRAAREIERAPVPKKRLIREEIGEKSYTGQNVRYGAEEGDCTGHFVRHSTGQNDRYNGGQNVRAIDNLPPDSLTKENLTPAGVPPINPPRGNNAESTEPFDPLQAVWGVALSHLSTLVNAPTLNAHLKPMRLVSVEGDVAVLIAPSAFTRNWIEGRHKAEVEAALAEALGTPVTVQITTGGK